jgi:hypothetical protein
MRRALSALISADSTSRGRMEWQRNSEHSFSSPRAEDSVCSFQAGDHTSSDEVETAFLFPDRPDRAVEAARLRPDCELGSAAGLASSRPSSPAAGEVARCGSAADSGRGVRAELGAAGVAVLEEDFWPLVLEASVFPFLGFDLPRAAIWRASSACIVSVGWKELVG